MSSDLPHRGTSETERHRQRETACPWSPEQSKCLILPPAWRAQRLLPPPLSCQDRGRRTHLHEPPGLADDGILETIQSKAVHLLHESDRGLSDLPHQGVGSVHRRRGRLWVWDQLHQRDVVGWIYLRRETEQRESGRRHWRLGVIPAELAHCSEGSAAGQTGPLEIQHQ